MKSKPACLIPKCFSGLSEEGKAKPTCSSFVFVTISAVLYLKIVYSILFSEFNNSFITYKTNATEVKIKNFHILQGNP